MEPKERMQCAKSILIVGFLAGVCISLPLWLTDKLYPVTPILFDVPLFPYPYDHIFLGLLFISLLLALLDKSRTWLWLAIGLMIAAVIIVQDHSRFRPWTFHYFFALTAVCIAYWHQRQETTEQMLNALRLMFIAIYFYSGLHKINQYFVFVLFPWMSSPIHSLIPHFPTKLLYFFSAAVPLVEIGIALALLFPRWRKLGTVIAGTMLVYVLWTIGPLGHDQSFVAWPWNIVFFSMAVILFWKSKEEVSSMDIVRPKHLFGWLVFVAFALYPALSFFNLGDPYMSWALYSGNLEKATVEVTQAAYAKLPLEMQQVAKFGGDTFNLDPRLYSYSIINLPMYPSVKLYHSFARYVCSFADNEGVTLVRHGRQHTFQPDIRLACTEL